MSNFVSKLPFGTLSGGAQDDVELVVARDIRKLEIEMGQSAHTLNIPNLVATLNQRHGLVPQESEATLAANVELAYGYIAGQVALPISRAGYASYVADEAVTAVRETVKRLGATAKGVTSKPRHT